ncbi:hypothetical protein THOM_0420, partial [Trachipleistophora hominis]
VRGGALILSRNQMSVAMVGPSEPEECV